MTRVFTRAEIEARSFESSVEQAIAVVQAGGSTPSGGGSSGTATVTVPVAARQHSQTVTVTGVTEESLIFVSLAPTEHTDENEPEGLDIVSMWGKAGTGEITFGLTFSTPTSGPIKLNWSAP